MARTHFVPDYFKIVKLNKKMNLLEIIQNTKLPLTFNQLMKFENEIAIVFIFDENSIEVPCLFSFCNYFKIKIFAVSQSDVNEVKSVIKHAQMICIPKDCPDIKSIEEKIQNSNFEQSFCRISID